VIFGIKLHLKFTKE